MKENDDRSLEGWANIILGKTEVHGSISGRIEPPKQPYPEYIVRKVRENMGLEEDDVSRDQEIQKSSKWEVLSRVLEWEGIIGYTNQILRWIDDIYETNLKEVKD